MFPLKDNIPTARFPVVTVLLIAINVAVFLFFQHPTGFSGVNDAKVVKYGAIPYEITHPGKHCDLDPQVHGNVICEGKAASVQTTEGVVSEPDPKHVPDKGSTWLTLLTAMFMHGGFLHIAGNMLFLWIFGNNVEDALGRPRYIAYYLLGGLAAFAGQVLVDPNSTVPTIGASGAIAAVLGGYILLYPRARVVTLIFIIFFVTIIELPAMVVLGIWFLEQIYFGAAGLSNPVGGSGGVAYFAHIGGFAFGLIFIRAFVKRRKRLQPELAAYR